MIQGIIEILSEDTTIRTLVGLNKAGNRYKVYPVKAPQTEAIDFNKYIICAKTSTEPTQVKDQESKLDRANFNVIAYGKSYEDVDDIHEACRTALDSKAAITDNGIEFARIWFTNDYDGYDTDAQMFVRVSSYSAHHRRAQAT